METLKIGLGRMGVRFLEDGREWRLHSFFYADDPILCDEMEENLKAMEEYIC